MQISLTIIFYVDFVLSYEKMNKSLNENAKPTNSDKNGESKQSNGNKLLILLTIKTGGGRSSTKKACKIKIEKKNLSSDFDKVRI